MAKSLGIAFGGGSARGLAHIGVLKVLEKNGIPISYISGTSMGALIGGLYAAGLSAAKLEHIALNLTGKQVVKLFRPTLTHSGFIDGDKISSFLSSLIPKRDMEKTNIPFKTIATDFSTGGKYIISKGDLFEAIRASCSIPVIFSPAVINDRILLDGGLSVPLPTAVVREMGAEIVISVNVIPAPEYKKNVKIAGDENPVMKNLTEKLRSWKLLNVKKFERNIMNIDYDKEKKILPSVFNISMQTRNIMEYNLIREDIITHKPDWLIEPNQNVVLGWFEFNKAKEIIKNGETAAVKIIDELKRALSRAG